MSSELEKNIIDRVKEILKVDNNSPLELLQLLRKYRNNLHPDHFTDETAKKEAELKFVEYTNLVKELDSFIQREKINKSPMELALYEPLYDNSSLQSQLDCVTEENEKLKDENEAYKNKIRELEEELMQKEAENLYKEQEKLIKFYRPRKLHVFSASLLIMLTGIIPLLTKVESISQKIVEYAPFSISLINNITFCLFIFIIMLSLINWFQYYLIKIKINEIKTPVFINKFLESLEENDSFTENHVYTFIYGKIFFIKRYLHFIGIKYYIAETILQLKDVFIHNLFDKQLIEISYADNLDRRFKIKGKPKYYFG
jgi:hypothetical protein